MKNFLKHLSGHKSSRRNTNNRKRIANRTTEYQTLEPRRLLATLTVDTLSDVVDLNDGLVSLREAITAANTNAAYGDAVAGEADGDVIRFDSAIVDGVIELNGSELEVTDDVIIRGGRVTIDALSSSRIFSINTTEPVRIANFNLVNGVAESGGAIQHLADGTLQLSNLQVSDNFASISGGAINKEQGALLIGNSSFENNKADRSGGAIALANSQLNLFKATFSSNSSNRGGGAIFVTDSDMFSTESDFFNNRARGQHGGAVDFDGVDSIAVFSNNTFEGNRSLRDGGALRLDTGQGAYILSSTLSGNSAGRFQPTGSSNLTGDGGAVSNEGPLIVRGSTITENISIGSGGGINSEGGNVQLFDTVLSSNRANSAGGGLRMIDGDLLVVDSAISENRTVTAARFLFSFKDLNFGGGGIQLEGNEDRTNEIIVRNSTLVGNVSADSGGAIFALTSDLSIFDSNIEENVAKGQQTSSFLGIAGKRRRGLSSFWRSKHCAFCNF